MKIIFGESLSSSKFLYGHEEYSGMHFCNLEHLVELSAFYLGIKKKPVAYPLRLERYRKALGSINGEHFFSKSFGVDSTGVAKRLLLIRDELLLYGYDFKQGPEVPLRLKALALVEAEFQKANGHGKSDSYLQLLNVLSSAGVKSKIPFSEIEVVTPTEYLSHPSKILLEKFESIGLNVNYAKRKAYPKKYSAESDLNKIKNALLFNDPIENFQNDGSLEFVFCQDQNESLRKMIARQNPVEDLLYYLPDQEKMARVDLIASAEGKSGFGSKSKSAARPINQLISLMHIFLWEPINVHQVLEFLTAKYKPLSNRLAEKLAKALASSPGVLSPDWQKALLSYKEDLSIEAAKKKAVLDMYEHLFLKERFSETAAPIIEAIRIYNVLKIYLKKSMMVSETRRHILLESLNLVESILELLSERQKNAEKTISRIELEKIIENLEMESSIVVCPEEVSRFSIIETTEACFRDVKNLCWFPFNNNATSKGSNFFAKDELVFLTKFGVGEAEELKAYNRKIESEIELISRVSKKITFVIAPIGEKNSAHPLFLRLKARGLKAEFFDIDKKEVDVLTIKKDIKPVPFEVPQWNFKKDINIKRVESYSALDNFFYNPFMYFLRYVARFPQISFLSINEDARIMGTVTHRIIEDFFTQFKDPMHEIYTNQEKLKQWHQEHYLSIVKNEATVLMMGYNLKKLEEVRQHSLLGLKNLCKHIKDNGWKVIQPEEEFEFEAIKNDLKIAGYIDLLLERNGELAVIDMKWGSMEERRKELDENRDVQLAIYFQSKQLPNISTVHTAYYIISKGVLMAKNNQGFSDAIVQTHMSQNSSYQELWEKIVNTYQARRAQFANGEVEVNASKELIQVISSPLDDELTLAPKKDASKYNDYKVLSGWSRGN